MRLQELTPPFSEEYHDVITTQVLPLHRALRPHLASTTLSSPSAYLSLLQTICTLSRGHLLLAFRSSRVPASEESPSSDAAAPPSSPSKEELVGFLLFCDLYDTFNGHRVLVEDWVVDAAHRGRGTGALMMAYLRQWCVDRGVRYVSMEVRSSLVRCQSILSRSGLGVVGLAFIARDPVPTSAAAAALNPAVLVQRIDAANFASEASTALLTSLERVYRCLRPSLSQLPSGTAAYLSTLHHIVQHGVFLLVAHTAEGEALGVAACRQLTTVDHGERLHVDDLVVDETRRSEGVGRVLMEAVKREARGKSDGTDGQRRVVTLESGSQRADAHRFYFRERMFVEELFWRAEVKAPK